MSSWVPLRNRSHFSLLSGVSKPKQMAKRCKELGYTSCALTDLGNIGASVQFVSALKDKGIKPILGCDFNECNNPKDKAINKDTDWPSLPIIAKNLDGWKSLIKSTSYSFHKDHLHGKPRIDIETLSNFGKGNFIALAGGMGTELSRCIFTDSDAAYSQTDYDTCKEKYVRQDWRESIREKAGEYINAFGRENLFLEIQHCDPDNNPAGLIAARAIRYIAIKDKLQRVATHDSYYPTKEYAPDHRVLLATAAKKTQRELEKVVHLGLNNKVRSKFLCDGYHIPSVEELSIHNDEEEIANSLLIADMCDSYDIRNQPILPTYPCPDGLNADEYLTALCKAGWSDKVYRRVDEAKWPEYSERVRKELEVIKGAGLSSYFLIVQDYCNWARSVGMIVGPGRGSGAGCLVSYLVGITAVDPIYHGLIFERFYNAGRNAPGHISLPDIDCDFPVNRRREIVAYLKAKYGDDKVANIATFNTMKGRGALTDVLRAHSVPFEEVKRITSHIPEEHRITEELQAMKERGDEPSIIRYALETDPESYSDWAKMDDEGQCEGVYGKYFEQAMRLEGTKRNISMHAAGVVLTSTPLAELCPLIYEEKIDGYIAGMDKDDLELMGQVKLDILGVASLDKIKGAINLLRYGYIESQDE